MRLRLTTHLPINGTRIGLVIWIGSIERGWIGLHLSPLKWGHIWRITGVPASRPAADTPTEAS